MKFSFSKAEFFDSRAYFLFIVLALNIFGCAGPMQVHQKINGLVANQRSELALDVLKNNQSQYGKRNRLLYQLDLGFLQHVQGHYLNSIESFKKAKEIHNQLYAYSISKGVGTFLVNDTLSDYRGEDFERVLINIFQALNFAAIDQYSAALVEARDVDILLKDINSKYPIELRNIYDEDAFARFLMGIFYEAAGNLDDAYISYKKAYAIYNRHPQLYPSQAPSILKDNLGSLALELHFPDYKEVLASLDQKSFTDFRARNQLGQVYIIQYVGFAPRKIEVAIPIPLSNGIITKVAFPQYQKQSRSMAASHIIALGKSGEKFERRLELAHDLDALAFTSLENRKARLIAKTALRTSGKFVLERYASKKVASKNDQESAQLFSAIASVYNLLTEQADLRSWATLPSRIYINRLILPAGSYSILDGSNHLGDVDVKPGEVRFMIHRDIR